ncbi:MAG: penicillin-binding protein activator LpoB [Gallionella sp.]
MRWIIILWFVCLAGCSTVEVGPSPTLVANAEWVILPFVNYTETPQAGLRAEAIAENVLRAAGKLNMQRYPNNLLTETLFESMDRKQLDAALLWARKEKRQYALTGSVSEWRYKVGVDGEPAVGMTLQVIDVASGEVLWAATGGRTGWSRESLSGVAQKLIDELLAPIQQAVH